MQTTTLGDTTVSYDETGTGEPVVLLHCSASSSVQWLALSEQFGERFHVVAPDLYSYGATGPWPGHGPLTLADEAALVTEVMSRCDGPVHLVGHSYGGAVALKVALKHPEKVRSLTLIEPVAFYLLQYGGLMERELFGEIGQLASAIRQAVVEGDYHGGMGRFVDYWSGEGTWARTKETTRAALAKQIGKVALDFSTTIKEPTPLDAVREIGVPTLILCGQESPMATFAIANLLADAMACARLTMIEDAGHMMPLTHADAVNAAIIDHVQTAGATGWRVAA